MHLPIFYALDKQYLKKMIKEHMPIESIDNIQKSVSYLKYHIFSRFIPYHDIVCSDENSPRNGVPRAISDVKKSFPSGHALLSTYAAIFMVVRNTK